MNNEKIDVSLKREDTRLRDWNRYALLVTQNCEFRLKREDTRLRDWNRKSTADLAVDFLTWKEKILDYEIETIISTTEKIDTKILKREDTRLRDWNLLLLEIITKHLKPVDFLKREDTRLRDWNLYGFISLHQIISLEKRRYSITRLKQKGCSINQLMADGNLKREDTRLRDWNLIFSRLSISFWLTWKEKILDYEIETL